jgi:hypothetical protein
MVESSTRHREEHEVPLACLVCLGPRMHSVSNVFQVFSSGVMDGHHHFLRVCFFRSDRTVAKGWVIFDPDRQRGLMSSD